LNIHWVRSRFGLVSQEPILFDLTIAENIAYGLENVPIEAIIDAATKANIHQFIQQLPQVKQYKKKVLSNNCYLFFLGL
jgi:ABC-type multidrug transport system fused ATPase/permease subunit